MMASTSVDLKALFLENLKRGVPFSDCFMLILKMTGHTQASLMACVNRKQPELSQFLNGHRGESVPFFLKALCRQEFGFDPFALARDAFKAQATQPVIPTREQVVQHD